MGKAHRNQRMGGKPAVKNQFPNQFKENQFNINLILKTENQT